MKTHSLCYFCNKELHENYGEDVAIQWQALFSRAIDDKKNIFHIYAHCGLESLKELEEVGAVLTHEDLTYSPLFYIKLLGLEIHEGNFSLCFIRDQHGMYIKRSGF
jgi:hypothetical protein